MPSNAEIASWIASGRLVPTPRAVVEQCSHILGSGSAAAEALKDADAHKGPVSFWVDQKTRVLIVEKKP